MPATEEVERVADSLSPPPDAVLSPKESALLHSVLGFFSLEGCDLALHYGQYSAQQEIETLAAIAQDPLVPPAERMAAVTLIRNHLREALMFSGAVRSGSLIQTRQLEGGGTAVARLDAQRLCLPGTRLPSPLETEHMLECALLDSDPTEQVPVSKEVFDAAQADSETVCNVDTGAEVTRSGIGPDGGSHQHA